MQKHLPRRLHLKQYCSQKSVKWFGCTDVSVKITKKFVCLNYCSYFCEQFSYKQYGSTKIYRQTNAHCTLCKGFGQSCTYCHYGVFDTTRNLFFWRNSRNSAHSQSYRLAAFKRAERCRTDSGRN